MSRTPSAPRTAAPRSLTLTPALLLALFAATSAHAARDPIEGRWLGTIGTPKERIPAGLEFVRRDDGTLALRLTQPILNVFGADTGAAVERDGDTVRVPSQHLELALVEGRLVGHYPGPNSPATFERVKTLPQPAEPPRVPLGPAPAWTTRLGGTVYASPVVADGVAYVGTTGGVLNAIDARDGKLRWARGLGCAMHGAVAVDGDAIYVACDDALHRLARKDGVGVWRYDPGDAVPRVLPHPNVFDWDWHGPTPLVADGVVYVGAGDGGFHAVDAKDGTRRWRFESGSKVRGGAALAGERVVFGNAAGTLHALERGNGREAWRYTTGAAIETAPVVHAGRVLIGDRGYGLHAIEAASGELAWKTYFWGSWVESEPVVVDGTIYIGASDLRRVSAIDAATGSVRWRTDVHGWTFGTPLVDGDVIRVGAAGGTPYFIDHRASYATLDRKSGKLLARRPLPDAGGHQWGIAGSVVRAGDLVLAATIEGALIAFPVR